METFLRERDRGDRPALGIWNSVGNSLVAEAVAAAGADYVCIDTQHGTTSEAAMVGMVQAVVAGGSVPVVRVPEMSAARIMKALDSGARGVVVPLVESGEQAAQAVAACRYPPRGTRSFGPFRASIQAGSSDPRELEKVALIAMIETRAGIEHLDEIAATEGLTAIYIGPSDLSLALGLPPGSFDAPEFVAVTDRILAACRANGVVPGLHCYDGRTARHAIERGFRMVTVAVDLSLLRQAVAGELGAARGA